MCRRLSGLVILGGVDTLRLCLSGSSEPGVDMVALFEVMLAMLCS
jgi:hypothetical protein